MKRDAIVLIGYGNVGHHLLSALCEIAEFDLYVLIRENTTAGLDKRGLVNWIFDYSSLESAPRFCFLSVRDDQIMSTAESLPDSWKKESTIIHSSGVLSADYLKDICIHFALFYPLNSFSKEIPFSWKGVPVFIDAYRDEDKNQVQILAERFQALPLDNDDRMREHLHLTAVMVNNFTNHWFRLAADFLKEKEIPFDYLLPLIRTTVAKLDFETPDKAQTGPAVRGDLNTLKKHLSMIDDEVLSDLYKKMSESINPSIINKY